jgi:hypothetical protein
MNDYIDIQSRVTEAFNAYAATYEQSTPKPNIQQVARRYPANNRLMYRLLGLLVTASVIVSGSHTIPVFAESLPAGTPPVIVFLVGGAAFVAIEAAILIYAYQRVEKSYSTNPHKSQEVQRLMGYGLALSIAVALGANVYSVLKPHMVDGLEGVWDAVKIGVSVLVGISAPVLAFIAGELFGLLTVEARARQSQILAEHDAAVEAWREGLREAWARDRVKWGASVKVERAPSAVLSETAARPVLSASDAQADKHGYGVGYVRMPDASQRVIDYLTANAEAGQMTVRQLAEVVGVGKTTAAAALKKWKEQNASS